MFIFAVKNASHAKKIANSKRLKEIAYDLEVIENILSKKYFKQEESTLVLYEDLLFAFKKEYKRKNNFIKQIFNLKVVRYV